MSKQLAEWTGEFGKAYLERNPKTVEELDALTLEQYGITKTDMFAGALEGRVPKDAKILEIGCNIGLQLGVLQKLGYKDLWGIEPFRDARLIAKQMWPDFNIVNGKIENIICPYYADLILTNGVLIHINNIGDAVENILDIGCAWIMGFEYWNKKRKAVEYHNRQDLMWKDDYMNYFFDGRYTIGYEKKFEFCKDETKLTQLYLLEWK